MATTWSMRKRDGGGRSAWSGDGGRGRRQGRARGGTPPDGQMGEAVLPVESESEHARELSRLALESGVTVLWWREPGLRARAGARF